MLERFLGDIYVTIKLFVSITLLLIHLGKILSGKNILMFFLSGSAPHFML